MKKFKKLIPAFCLLLVSAVLMGTSTFAWFSMNKNVTATGMSVTAKSDSVWLQIKNADGASVDANKTQANGKIATANIYPAKWNGTAAEEKWQTASSDDPASATANAAGYVDVSVGDVGDYRLLNTFTISIKENTAPEAKNLKVKTCKVTGTSVFLNAVSVVVVCGDKIQTISANGKTSGTSFDVADAVVLAETVTTADTTVSVYVYIDGDNTNVYTNNMTAANVTGISVELVFGVD